MEALVDKDTVQLIVYCSVGIAALGILSFTVIASIAFNRTQKGAAKSFGLLFRRGDFLRIITVLAIIYATLILALLGLFEQSVATILSGVAGYVLGGLSTGSKPDVLTSDNVD